MLDARERFTKTVTAYSKYRPSYPGELIQWVAETSGITRGGRVVDLGCGTGISARLFAARGLMVVGIDPNDAMLTEARRTPGVSYRKGEAAATGLVEESIDLAVAAQSFHWFDIPKTMDELVRILRPTGWCAAFWNVRSKAPVMVEYEELLNGIDDYRAVPKPWEAIARIEASPDIRNLRAAVFPQSQKLTREELIGRSSSSSYVANLGDKWDAFEKSLSDLFDRHAVDGHIDFSYDSTVRMWQV